MVIVFTTLIFLFVILFLFFTHELGHFLFAKKVGVPVLEFGFGFPPRLFKIKKGETIYSFNVIPFGAFVKILGLEDPKNKNPKAYWNQSISRRFMIAIGGIFSNLFWAWFILTIILGICSFLPARNFVVIDQVLKGSAAAEAGLKQGDLIIQINGQSFEKTEKVGEFTRSHQNQQVKIVIRRFGRNLEKEIKLGTGQAPLGVSMIDAALFSKMPLWKTPWVSLTILGNALYLTVLYLGKAIISVFSREVVSFELGGPVAIWGYVSQFASMGYLYLGRLLAFLSLGLGFSNFLPLPAFDGGRLLFLLLERIFGKKLVKPELENLIHTGGFAGLMVLMVLITYKDILRLLGR